ncbi:MAG: recombination mediator RecR [Myxococcota bacterium]
MLLEEPIRRLMDQFCRLPGVGERTALRFVLHLLGDGREAVAGFTDALAQVAQRVHECPVCCALTAQEPSCKVCGCPSRDRSTVCVVAGVQDLMAVEATGEYRGLYHVLHGTLSPMDGVGPGQLRVDVLLHRLEQGVVKEVILATPPSVEGEATALYLTERLQGRALSVTRIASGVPVGGELQFADRLTLSRALEGRVSAAVS